MTKNSYEASVASDHSYCWSEVTVKYLLKPGNRGTFCFRHTLVLKLSSGPPYFPGSFTVGWVTSHQLSLSRTFWRASPHLHLCLLGRSDPGACVWRWQNKWDLGPDSSVGRRALQKYEINCCAKLLRFWIPYYLSIACLILTTLSSQSKASKISI